MTLTIAQQLLAIGAGSALIMLALWALQLRTRDAGVVDVAWAGCLGLSAIFAAITGDGDLSRRIIIGAIGGFWGLRLASHLLFDRVLRGPEDGRYQMMREQFGDRINPILLAFFEAQALLVVILCIPFLLAASASPTSPALTDIAGAALWLIGITGETIADRQLLRFKRNPANAGKVCNVGLWRYSRHPNYFFEWLMWCAFAIVALPADYGWIGISAPALILLFVLKLTGIPPTEARAIRSRGDAYRRYQQTTSAFFPWFPREDTK